MMGMNRYFCALNFILITTVYESNGLLSKNIHVTGNDQNGKIITRIRDIARDFFVYHISERRRPRWVCT